MTLNEIKTILFSGSGVLLILMTIIQIAPIKFNPWSRIGRCIGRLINGEVLTEVNNVRKEVYNVNQELADHKEKSAQREATLCRTHILRFGDELRHGVPHSKEHYEQILIDIDSYEEYCEKHQDYKNNIAVATIAHIKKMYQKSLEEDSFL